MIVLDDFTEQSAVDIATLNRLALLTPAQDVAIGLDDVVEEHDSWGVLEVAEGEACRDTLRQVDVVHDEKVDECFVQWHEYDFIAISDMVLDDIEPLHVDMQALHPTSHVLTEHIGQRSGSTGGNLTLHLL